MEICTEYFDDGAVFVVTIDPEAEWHVSKFPTPLVTVDYDRDGKVFQIVAVGAMAKRFSAAVKTTPVGMRTSNFLISLIPCGARVTDPAQSG